MVTRNSQILKFSSVILARKRYLASSKRHVAWPGGPVLGWLFAVIRPSGHLSGAGGGLSAITATGCSVSGACAAHRSPGGRTLRQSREWRRHTTAADGADSRTIGMCRTPVTVLWPTGNVRVERGRERGGERGRGIEREREREEIIRG